jgi:hypothetical protein
MDIFSIGIGAGGVIVLYLLCFVLFKGLPAAWAWLKAKSSEAATELTSIRADIAGASAKVTALEQGAVAELKTGLAAVQADVATLKAKISPAA